MRITPFTTVQQSFGKSAGFGEPCLETICLHRDNFTYSLHYSEFHGSKIEPILKCFFVRPLTAYNDHFLAPWGGQAGFTVLHLVQRLSVIRLHFPLSSLNNRQCTLDCQFSSQ